MNLFAFILPLFPVISLSVAFDGLEIPEYSDTSMVIHHTGFTLEYSEEHEQAKWVAYVLTKDELSGTIDRTDNYRADPDVPTESAQLADYKYSGYDRGHLYPSADAKWNTNSMNECFYLSNMSPQDHSFNAGVWLRLENAVRDWANKIDTIYVVTAGVLTENLPTIGSNNVAIPEYFYKVLLCNANGRYSGIGFIMKSENSSESLPSFTVTIDLVEQITGINFFPQLPDEIENVIENTIEFVTWSGFDNGIHNPVRYTYKPEKTVEYYTLRGQSLLNRNNRYSSNIFVSKRLLIINIPFD